MVNPKSHFIPDLDNLFFPALDLLNMKDYAIEQDLSEKGKVA